MSQFDDVADASETVENISDSTINEHTKVPSTTEGKLFMIN